MNEEIVILEKILPQLATVMNIVPGERVCMKESDPLLILERRMRKCDLQKELTTYNEIFAENEGASRDNLVAAAVSYVKIKVLVEREELDFNPRSYRKLIKEFKLLITKVNNIIHLTQVNSMTADEYQKEKIELVLDKNKAFQEAFRAEIAKLEKQMERIPAIDTEEQVEEISSVSSKQKETKSAEAKKQELRLSFPKVISRIRKGIKRLQEKKSVDERLKNVEKEQSMTKCVEIPFYDKSLTFTEVITCKDTPAYSLLKRKNNIYFGITRNVGKTSYDNRDQSLIELTDATEEFLQFMSEDLLSGGYQLQLFKEKEKEGLRMYFDFISNCFQKFIGVTLTVQEYLRFKTYYNRLVMRMFELEQKEKEIYCKALIVVDAYRSYMESYNLEFADEEATMISNIIQNNIEDYINDIDLIITHHIVDAEAKDELQELKKRINEFNKIEADVSEANETEQEIQIRTLPSALPYEGLGFSPQTFGVPAFPVGINQGLMQIVIQILNQDKEIVDEALYAGNNIRQALYDYSTKEAYIKRLGFRSNGADVFYKEEVK